MQRFELKSRDGQPAVVWFDERGGGFFMYAVQGEGDSVIAQGGADHELVTFDAFIAATEPYIDWRAKVVLSIELKRLKRRAAAEDFANAI